MNPEPIVLVTGGAGFIGSHLVRRLLAEGAAVRVLDDLSTGYEANLAEIRERIEFRRGSVTDPRALTAAMKGTGVVFHLAAIPSVPRSLRDPEGTHRTNVEGTLHVLEAAYSAGVRRFVYAASSSAYGDTAHLPKRESDPAVPISPYGVQKLAGELYASAWTRLGRIDTISLRLFNVYGPRQDPRSEYAAVIPRFLAAVRRGEPPVIYGDGRQTRDFTYVEDVVAGMLAAAKIPCGDGAVVNLATGTPVSLRDLAGICLRIGGRGGEPRFEPPRPGDILHSYGDHRRARELLGFTPRYRIEEGLRETYRWLCANPPDAAPRG